MSIEDKFNLIGHGGTSVRQYDAKGNTSTSNIKIIEVGPSQQFTATINVNSEDDSKGGTKRVDVLYERVVAKVVGVK